MFFLTKFILVKETVGKCHLTVNTVNHAYMQVLNLDLRTGKITFNIIKEEEKVHGLIKAGPCTGNLSKFK